MIWVICAYPIPSQLYMTTQSEIDLSCKNRSCIADSNFLPQDQSPASAWRLITYLLWGSNILSFKSLVRSGKPQIQALVLVGREEPAVPVVITKLSRASCSMKHSLDDSWIRDASSNESQVCLRNVCATTGLVGHQVAFLGCCVALRMGGHNEPGRQSLAWCKPLALGVVQIA